MSINPEIALEVNLDPAHYVTFDLTSGAQVFGFAAIVFGYSLKNPSGAATAALDFYDATDTTSAKPVIPLTFATSESLSDWFGDRGIFFKNGLYANVTSGEVKGSVFFRYHDYPR